MRITSQMMMRSTLNDVNGALRRLQQSQKTLSTGREIRRPSDDPGRASTAMNMRSQIRRADQYARTMQDAKSWAGTADTALVNGLDLVQRVKALAVRGANTASLSQTARDALVSEIKSLRTGLLDVANTKYLDRPIFAGNAAGTADGEAFDTSGAYHGDDGAVFRDVAPGTTVRVNVGGTQIFGDGSAGSPNVFQVIEDLGNAISAGSDADIETQHELLDVATRRMAAVTGEVGSLGSRLTKVESRQALALQELKSSLSGVEDADLAESIIDVQTKRTAYEAALKSASRVMPPSLLDYMR